MKPHAKPQPLCHRCKKPMALHAVEVVQDIGQKNGEASGVAATMEIFHCDSCGQLTAREQAEAA